MYNTYTGIWNGGLMLIASGLGFGASIKLNKALLSILKFRVLY